MISAEENKNKSDLISAPKECSGHSHLMQLVRVNIGDVNMPTD